MTSCAYPSVYITASTPHASFASDNLSLIAIITVFLFVATTTYLSSTWASRAAIIAAGVITAAIIFVVAASGVMQCPDRPELRVDDDRFEDELHEDVRLYAQPVAAIESEATITLENHTVRCVGGCDAFTITDNATRMTPSEEIDEYIGLQPCYANHTIYVRGPDSDASLPTCDVPVELLQ